MKRLLLLFTLFAIITSQSGREDCSSFESSIASACSSLGNTYNRCYYSEGQCKSSLYNCEDYKPSSNFDDESCRSIIPDNYQKVECVVEGNPKTCVSKKKSCEQTTDETVCPYLDAGEDKRCVFTNGKCEAHYNECSKASQSECNNNIPQNNQKKCNWDSSCQEKDRECNKYITYTDSYGSHAGNQYCYQLKADDNDQVCILDEGNCKSVYKSCDNGNGDDTKCNRIKPLIYNNMGYYTFSSTKYCNYSATNCEVKTKNCNQYIKGTNGEYCTSLEAENTNKKCVYDTDKDECTEQYTSCSSYSSDNSVTNLKPDDCKKINPGSQYIECELEGNQCTDKQKDCKDIKDKETCNEYNSYFSTKYCLFLESNNTCVKSFKTCEEYNTNTNQNDCELIQPNYYDYDHNYDSYTYKCIFNADDSSCKKQKMTCEDYQGKDEKECDKITYNLDDKSTYSCKMIDGKCKKEYRYCDSYTGTDKAKCEAIRVDPYKCKYDTDDKECYQEYGTCNEYKGTDPTICNYYHSKDENKRCILVNGKCIEKEYYYSCSDYEGTNKEVCQSIIPVYERTKKCVYTNKGCKEQNKVCEDAKDESECADVLVSDSTKKHCVFINNACKEQFKDCDTYNKENSIEQKECESIVLNDKYGSNSYKYRCKYTAPTNEGKGTCTEVARNCDDFDVELIRKECSSISLMDYLKKCTFNSNDQSCSIKEKTCLDMSYMPYYSNPSEEYCNKFTASSSNKICVAGINGCIEVEKEKNSNNSSFELKLSQIVFILLYLLF